MTKRAGWSGITAWLLFAHKSQRGKLRRYTCDAHIGAWIPVNAIWAGLVHIMSTAPASVSVCLLRHLFSHFSRPAFIKHWQNAVISSLTEEGKRVMVSIYLLYIANALGFFRSNFTRNNQSEVAWTVGRVYLLIWKVAIHLY